MSHDSTADVVIRSRMTSGGTEFTVLCGASARVLGGPFTVMTDAVGFAVTEATRTNARLMYEAHDERGRIIGERLLLRTAASI
jgi:hypothetical protein